MCAGEWNGHILFHVCVINRSLILKLVQDVGAYVPENIHAYFMGDILPTSAPHLPDNLKSHECIHNVHVAVGDKSFRNVMNLKSDLSLGNFYISKACKQTLASVFFNHLMPNGHFSSRTAPLTYRCCIF
jgi:hypothetical protein